MLDSKVEAFIEGFLKEQYEAGKMETGLYQFKGVFVLMDRVNDVFTFQWFDEAPEIVLPAIDQKGGKLKVFHSVCDGLNEMPSRPNGSRQADIMMCTQTKASFKRKCEELGVRIREREIRELTNSSAQYALVQPEVLLWRPLLEFNGEFKPVIGRSK